MKKIKVLFVCIHNSARSQMAEAYLNHLGKGKFQAESAGIEAGTLNPLAVKVMKEDGIDISGHQAKEVADFYQKGKLYTYVVTVCDESNAERCPVFPGIKQQLHWSFPDPSAFKGSENEKLEMTRKVRDQIKKKIESFIEAVG